MIKCQIPHELVVDQYRRNQHGEYPVRISKRIVRGDSEVIEFHCPGLHCRHEFLVRNVGKSYGMGLLLCPPLLFHLQRQPGYSKGKDAPALWVYDGQRHTLAGEDITGYFYQLLSNVFCRSFTLYQHTGHGEHCV